MQPGAISLLPVVHGRLEFAAAVRLELERLDPEVVAVELPSTLQNAVLRAVDRLPLLSIVRYIDEEGAWVYLPIEPTDAIVEALRWARERDRAVHLVDLDIRGIGTRHDHLPDPYALRRIGYQAYVDAYHDARPALPPEEQPRDDLLRETAMACRCRALARDGARVALVLGLAHAGGVAARLEEEVALPFGRRRREEVEVLHLSRGSSQEVMAEPPFLAAVYEATRTGGGEALLSLDRRLLTVSLLQEAREGYRTETGEDLSPGRLRTLLKFLRNYALVEARLAPDLYQVLVAARSCVDDDYAYELWKRATDYPHQTDTPDVGVIELSVEELYERSRHIRFRRTLRQRQRLLRLVRQRRKEQRAGEWSEQWKGAMLCSYPPEDITIEGYGAFLGKKAAGMLAAENTRVEPFTVSLLDGIDMRETIRNWHEGRLYVREHRRMKGKAGAVILIFEDKDHEQRYGWRMTWHGEHDQESDMALYATPPKKHLVGPGIARCEYGGFLMTYPPGRMLNVWQDPFYDVARSPAERLLLAGLDYSTEKLIVYIAASPPRSWLQNLALRMRRKVAYIPIGQLSPVTLKQIRFFHVLDNHQVRSYAKEYIW